jgi:hypothetical protein
MLGNLDSARTYYRQFWAAVPQLEPGKRAELEAQLAALDARTPKAAPPLDPPPPSAPKPPLRPNALDFSDAHSAADKNGRRPSDPLRPSDKARQVQIAGENSLIVAGAMTTALGAALVGIGEVIVHLNDSKSGISSDQKLADEIIGDFPLGLGVAALLVGVPMLIAGIVKDASPVKTAVARRWNVVPIVTNHSSGLVTVGQF